MELVVRNISNNALYDVISYDETTQTMKLRGKYATFTTPYSKELFVKLGYRLEKKQPSDTGTVKNG